MDFSLSGDKISCLKQCAAKFSPTKKKLDYNGQKKTSNLSILKTYKLGSPVHIFIITPTLILPVGTSKGTY